MAGHQRSCAVFGSIKKNKSFARPVYAAERDERRVVSARAALLHPAAISETHFKNNEFAFINLDLAEFVSEVRL